MRPRPWQLCLLLGLLVAGTAAADNAVRPEVGQEAPGFSLESSAGETHELKQLRGEKNLVVVFFRGTW